MKIYNPREVFRAKLLAVASSTDLLLTSQPSDCAEMLEMLDSADAQINALRTAVISAHDVFVQYAEHHEAKPDMEKAQRNRDMARQMREALEVR